MGGNLPTETGTVARFIRNFLRRFDRIGVPRERRSGAVGAEYLPALIQAFSPRRR